MVGRKYLTIDIMQIKLTKITRRPKTKYLFYQSEFEILFCPDENLLTKFFGDNEYTNYSCNLNSSKRSKTHSVNTAENSTK